MNPHQIVVCKVQSKRTSHVRASQETESLTRFTGGWAGGESQSPGPMTAWAQRNTRLAMATASTHSSRVTLSETPDRHHGTQAP